MGRSQMTRSGHRPPPYSRTRTLWNIGAETSGLLRLDVGLSDHLAPFLGLVRDELSELGHAHRRWQPSQLYNARLDLGVDEGGINLSIEHLDDLRRRTARGGETSPRTRLIARHGFRYRRNVGQKLQTGQRRYAERA